MSELIHIFAWSPAGFWLPGGAVDGGESLTSAAKRETLEEAGIDIHLKGYRTCYAAASTVA